MDELFRKAAEYADIRDWKGSLPYDKLIRYNEYIKEHVIEYKKQQG